MGVPHHEERYADICNVFGCKKTLSLMFHEKEDNRDEMSRFSERRTTKKEK